MGLDRPEPTAWEIIVKTAVVHTVTYFVVGVLAFFLLDYRHLYANTDLRFIMRPTTHPLVMAGPLFQPLRGMIFGLAFVALRRSFFVPGGWRVMWLVLVCLSIFGTFGPSPASLEGMIYTTLPLRLHLIGLPEVLLQSFLLAFIVFHWATHPRRWVTWVVGSLFVLVMAIPIFGLMHRAA
jgi:hypothetical protein